MIRFFGALLGNGEACKVCVFWGDDEGGPRVGVLPLDEALADNAADANELWVRAAIREVTREGEFQQWQWLLVEGRVAMAERASLDDGALPGSAGQG